MSLTRFVLPGLMLGLVLSLVPSVAKAGVVFGNLGSSGTSPSDGGFDGLTLSGAGRYAAIGFNTGTATFGTLKVNSVTLALSGSAAASNVEIWSSTGSAATAAPLSNLGTAISVSAPTGNLYSFSFSANPESGVQLSASTDYWVVLKYPGVSTTWQVQDPSSNPGPQNSSTYAAITNYARQSANSGSTWSTPGAVNQPLGVSINAVPEPSTYVMAGIGAGLAGLAQLRRRRVLAV